MRELQPDQIIRQWQKPVYNLALRLLGDTTEAMDATQDIFMQLLRVLPQYDMSRDFAPWLYSLALNVVRNRRRRDSARLRRESQAAIPEAVPSFLSDVEKVEMQDLVQRCISELPEDMREPVVLRYYQGLSQHETAAILQLPRATLQDRLAKAFKMLRAALENSGYSMAVPGIQQLMSSTPSATLPPGLTQSLFELARIQVAVSGGAALTTGGFLIMKNIILILFAAVLVLWLGWQGTMFLVSPPALIQTSGNEVARISDTPESNKLQKPEPISVTDMDISSPASSEDRSESFSNENGDIQETDTISSTPNAESSVPLEEVEYLVPSLPGHDYVLSDQLKNAKTGVPIVGAHVTIYSSYVDTDGEVLSSIQTDDSGMFHAVGLPEYVGVLISADGFGLGASDDGVRTYYQLGNVYPVKLGKDIGKHFTHGHSVFSLQPQGGVSGRLFDSMHQPIANVKVDAEVILKRVSSGTRIILHPVTRSDGSFFLALEGMGGIKAPFGVQLTLFNEGHSPVKAEVKVNHAGEVVNLGDMIFQSGNSIAGKVLGPDRELMSDCEVRILPLPINGKYDLSQLESPLRGTRKYSGSTGNDGRFRIEGLDFDKGFVVVLKTGFIPLICSHSLHGQEEEFVLEKGDTLTGLVRVESGKAAKRVKVIALSSTLVEGVEFILLRECRSNDDGSFQLSGVLQGRCQVFLDKNDMDMLDYYPVSTDTQTDMLSNTQGLVFHVQPTCRVKIVVSNISEAIAAGAWEGTSTSLFESGADGQWQSAEKYRSQIGAFPDALRCEYLVPGFYRLTFEHPQRTTQIVKFTVRKGVKSCTVEALLTFPH